MRNNVRRPGGASLSTTGQPSCHSCCGVTATDRSATFLALRPGRGRGDAVIAFALPGPGLSDGRLGWRRS